MLIVLIVGIVLLVLGIILISTDDGGNGLGIPPAFMGVYALFISIVLIACGGNEGIFNYKPRIAKMQKLECGITLYNDSLHKYVVGDPIRTFAIDELNSLVSEAKTINSVNEYMKTHHNYKVWMWGRWDKRLDCLPLIKIPPDIPTK